MRLLHMLPKMGKIINGRHAQVLHLYALLSIMSSPSYSHLKSESIKGIALQLSEPIIAITGAKHVGTDYLALMTNSSIHTYLVGINGYDLLQLSKWSEVVELVGEVESESSVLEFKFSVAEKGIGAGETIAGIILVCTRQMCM